jgi:sulfur carrier protein
MAILVNGDPHPWRQGLTVEQLLQEKHFSFPLRVIFVNKQLVRKPEIPTTVLSDGDEVQVIHLIGGG